MRVDNARDAKDLSISAIMDDEFVKNIYDNDILPGIIQEAQKGQTVLNYNLYAIKYEDITKIQKLKKLLILKNFTVHVDSFFEYMVIEWEK